MVNISANFSSSKSETNCICGEQESMKHIYNACKMLNMNENLLPYEKIYFGQVNEQIEILQKLEENLRRRDIILNLDNEPCDPSGSAACISSFWWNIYWSTALYKQLTRCTTSAQCTEAGLNGCATVPSKMCALQCHKMCTTVPDSCSIFCYCCYWGTHAKI